MPATNNIKADVKAGKLTITVDLGAASLKAAKPSASGKTMSVATTGGFIKIDSPAGWDLSFGLNVIGKQG